MADIRRNRTPRKSDERVCPVLTYGNNGRVEMNEMDRDDAREMIEKTLTGRGVFTVESAGEEGDVLIPAAQVTSITLKPASPAKARPPKF